MKGRYGERDIQMMYQHIPPDGWQVAITANGIRYYGGFQPLAEALEEFAHEYTTGQPLDSIEILPVWFETLHEDVP